MAAIYGTIGEMNRSTAYYEQCLRLLDELNHKYLKAYILNNLSVILYQKGKSNEALKALEDSLKLFNELGRERGKAMTYVNLIDLLTMKGDIEYAREYLQELKQLKNNLNVNIVNLSYLYCKALILKSSSRTLNRGKAEELLKRILKDKNIQHDFSINVLFTLCELLLIDLKLTNNSEVLEEINSLISRLSESAEKSRSLWILGETYLLKAKLALISLNLKEARKCLTEGQKIAEKYGLKLLARQISEEHDVLLKKLNMWENFKESDVPLSKRIELSHLDDQVNKMTQKQMINVPELSEEEPIFLLIMSEGGRPIFSQSFKQHKHFEDHLFGGFLSAINSFMDEMFSEGLDRASFGEHTLLINSVMPFFMCYIFKGQSYSAQHRLRYFLDKLKSDMKTWQSFEKFYKSNQEIQLKDIPSLEPLITEVFIEREIPMNY
jgi:tetratricopeptide (TPR) repeat protein